MDTPGGLDLSMRSIIKGILGSSIPVAVFVSPNGARAASAGTYILYASHVAAMAPATNLGAATPINIGEPPQDREPAAAKRKSDKTKDAQDGNEAQSSRQAMMRKQTNDAAAYIRGFAQLRGRNADWADRAVREAVSLSAQEALKLKVVDVVAADVPWLLRQLDCRKLSVPGREVRLATAGAETIEYRADWRLQMLAVITDPSIAYILLLVGVYGLMFEFMNPGFVAPGVIGAICLLLALFAFQMLPVNYAGLALIALGIGLFVAEHYVAGFGVLGMGGLVAFVIGSIMLIDTDIPGYTVPWRMIALTTVASAAFLLLVLGLALKSRRRPVVSGREQLMGATGESLDPSYGESHARIHGEIWQVRSRVPLAAGTRVKVVGVDGLVLEVEPVGNSGGLA
jgi:membrane-bound serine protease (ClpP class)